MNTPVINRRWVVAMAGAGLMMMLGAIYSWSLFTQPLIASFAWSNTTTTWTFSLAIFFLSIGAVIGGRLQDQVGTRVVALTGVALWGAGNLLTGLGTPHFGAWWMYLSYGAIGGFGIGMGYIASVAVVTQWFPDRRGVASGLVVMGFGLGAVGYNFIVKSLPSFGAAAAAAADLTLHSLSDGAISPVHTQSVMDVFMMSGVTFLVIGSGCALFLSDPPNAAVRASLEERSYATSEMLRTPQLYLLWLMLFSNVTAGILVISNALPIMQELTGLAPKVVAGAFAAVCLFNALGRFFWGAVSDHFGRNRAFALIFAIQICVFIAMGYTHELPTVALAYAVVLLCFGGGFGVMPSFNADYFGTRHLGANYGAILTAWGAAGIIGPLFAAEVKDLTGSFSDALPMVAILLSLAMVLPAVTKRPARTGSVLMSNAR